MQNEVELEGEKEIKRREKYVGSYFGQIDRQTDGWMD